MGIAAQQDGELAQFVVTDAVQTATQIEHDHAKEGGRSHVDIWLSYHPDLREVPRVRRTVEWLIEQFSPRLYPWFRDDYVDPRDFARLYHGEDVPDTFAPFDDRRMNGSSL